MKALVDILVGLAVLLALVYGSEQVVLRIKQELIRKLAQPVSLTKLSSQLTDDNTWWE